MFPQYIPMIVLKYLQATTRRCSHSLGQTSRKVELHIGRIYNYINLENV